MIRAPRRPFLPTKKGTGWKRSKNGKTVRTYDAPATPADRVIASGILLPPEREHLECLRQSIDLAEAKTYSPSSPRRLTPFREHIT